MKLYEIYVNLWTMCTNTLSDEEMTKIKVVDLDEYYNFYFHDFFSLNHLVFQNVVWICHFLKFKFWIVQTKSPGKMTKINVINLVELYNFYIHDFFIRNHMIFQYVVSSFHIFEFQNFIFSNKVIRNLRGNILE
jgi:hypothetical protein